MSAWPTSVAPLCAVALLALSGCKTPEPHEYEGVEAGDCSDGDDNDADGATDCDDSDCESHLDCNPNTSEWIQTTTVTDTDPVTGETTGFDCDADDTSGLPESGTTLLDRMDPGILPLCSGEFVASVDFSLNLMTTSGSIIDTYPTIDQLGKMRYDPEIRRLYGAHLGNGDLGIYNVDDWSFEQIGSLPGPVVDIELGAEGIAWVTAETSGVATYVARVEGLTAIPTHEFDIGNYGTRLTFAKDAGMVYAGGGPSAAVAGALWDAKAETLEVVDSVTGACNGAAGEVDATNDGEHVVVACTGGNNGEGTTEDFYGFDLATSNGVYDVSGGITGSFSPDETLFVTFDGNTFTLFDTDQHAQIATHDPDLEACPDADVQHVEWSRGGRIVMASYTCNSKTDDAAVSWWVLP